MKERIADFLICFIIGMILTGLVIIGWKFITMVVIPISLIIFKQIPPGVIKWLIASLIVAIWIYGTTDNIRDNFNLDDKDN